MADRLPRRAGPRPRTTPSNPRVQLDQQPADTTQRALLAAELFALSGVTERETVAALVSAAHAYATQSEEARR